MFYQENVPSPVDLKESDALADVIYENGTKCIGKSSHSFLNRVLGSVENLVPPIAQRTFGICVLEHTYNDIVESTALASLVPGQIIVVKNGEFKLEDGLTYSMGVESPFVGILKSVDLETGSIEIIEEVGGECRTTSYPLNALIKGKLKVFKPVHRHDIGW